MPSCAVKWCGKQSKTSSYKTDGITFHRIPKNPEVKEKWIDKINRENWFPTKHHAVCSRHFTPDCFEYLKQRRRLFSSAIPTMFLPILVQVSNGMTDSNTNDPGPSHHNIALTTNSCNTVTLKKPRYIDSSVQNCEGAQDLQAQTSTSVFLTPKKDKSLKRKDTEGLELLDKNVEDAPGTSSQNVNQDSSSNGTEIQVFCPRCNTQVPHTAEGIQQDQTKILVAKVYHYLEQEYEELKTIYGDFDLTPLSKFRQRTALATGVSESTVFEILHEEEGRNAEKRQEPPEERRRGRKRSRQTQSLSEEDSSNDNLDDGGQSSYDLEPKIESEIKTLVVKIEPPESYKEQTDYDSISTEVKTEPPDYDVNNTNETLALTENSGTKRKGRKKSRRSDVTSTRQHSQGESSTAAAWSSVRLTAELDESGLLEDTEVKMEKVEIGEEGFS